MRQRDRLKKRFHKTRNNEDLEKYRQMRNKVVSMIRKKTQYKNIPENSVKIDAAIKGNFGAQ